MKRAARNRLCSQRAMVDDTYSGRIVPHSETGNWPSGVLGDRRQLGAPTRLVNFTPEQHWAKLPAKSMYSTGRIATYADFQLRRVAELDVLKLFFLFVARRSRDTNAGGGSRIAHRGRWLPGWIERVALPDRVPVGVLRGRASLRGPAFH